VQQDIGCVLARFRARRSLDFVRLRGRPFATDHHRSCDDRPTVRSLPRNSVPRGDQGGSIDPSGIDQRCPCPRPIDTFSSASQIGQRQMGAVKSAAQAAANAIIGFRASADGADCLRTSFKLL
jgi:hypothetical protein